MRKFDLRKWQMRKFNVRKRASPKEEVYKQKCNILDHLRNPIAVARIPNDLCERVLQVCMCYTPVAKMQSAQRIISGLICKWSLFLFTEILN